MTIYEKLCLIHNEHFHELHNENERQFIEDVYDGLLGVPLDINDEDITEYLSPRQTSWINDIAVEVGISEN